MVEVEHQPLLHHRLVGGIGRHRNPRRGIHQIILAEVRRVVAARHLLRRRQREGHGRGSRRGLGSLAPRVVHMENELGRSGVPAPAAGVLGRVAGITRRYAEHGRRRPGTRSHRHADVAHAFRVEHLIGQRRHGPLVVGLRREYTQLVALAPQHVVLQEVGARSRLPALECDVQRNDPFVGTSRLGQVIVILRTAAEQHRRRQHSRYYMQFHIAVSVCMFEIRMMIRYPSRLCRSMPQALPRA